MKLTKMGACLKGGRVLARAVSFKTLKVTKGSSTHKIQGRKLSGHAFCVIEAPMVSVIEPEDSPKFVRSKGDCLDADRIIARARNIQNKEPFVHPKNGRLERMLLEGTVSCYIEKPLRVRKRG